MDKQGKHTKSRTPLFDGLNYAFWNVRMKVYLQAQGVEVWRVVITKHNIPIDPPIDHATKRTYEENSKAMNATLSSLTETTFVKVMHYKTMKEIWDKLIHCHGV
jgi:ABC-type uncharacterized transport system fused permease/ATPase subunit